MGQTSVGLPSKDVMYVQASPNQKNHSRHSKLLSHNGSIIPSFFESRRILTTLSVVSLCYFNVSGGPTGSEEMISAGGPLIGIIGIFLFPIMWAIPIALVTAELSTTYPDDGGYTVWVYHAWGPFWAFQEGYWSWISGVIDNAMYPTLALSVLQTYNIFQTNISQYVFKVTITLILSIPSLYGVNIIGKGMTSLSIIVILPFLLFTIWGFIVADDWSALLEYRPLISTSSEEGINWAKLINILFWNFNGFDGMSVFAGEVENPSKTYPKALVSAVALVSFSYLMPLIAGVAVNKPHWTEWEEGSFALMSENIGGPFLKVLISFSTVISNFGMFITELFVDSFQLYGMAEQGLAPSIFKRRHEKYDTPRNAIYGSVFFMFIILWLDFDTILIINNAILSISIILILLSFAKLRLKQPHVYRPYKVPGGNGIIGFFCISQIFLMIFLLIKSIDKLFVGIIIIVIIIFGFIYGGLCYYFGLYNKDKILDNSTDNSTSNDLEDDR